MSTITHQVMYLIFMQRTRAQHASVIRWHGGGLSWYAKYRANVFVSEAGHRPENKQWFDISLAKSRQRCQFSMRGVFLSNLNGFVKPV